MSDYCSDCGDYCRGHESDTPVDIEFIAELDALDDEEADTLADRLAATAAGTFGEEAAVWLLDQHGHWLPELERYGLIDEVPYAGSTDKATIINWERLNISLNRLIGTPSEWQVLRIASALGGAQSTQLITLTSLDSSNRLLVLHAVAWAMGGRSYADELGLLARDQECHGCGYDPRNEHMTGHHPRCPA